VALFAATAGGASALDRAGSIAAIVGASIALLLLLAGLFRWNLTRQRRQTVANLLHEGNELLVRVSREHESQVQQWNTLIHELDQWWRRVEMTVGEFRGDLLPVLRSETGRPIFDYTGHNLDYNAHRNWLLQRIGQLEKALQQL
jgi:leucyl aminopeptidase (aminopeptidase T)